MFKSVTPQGPSGRCQIEGAPELGVAKSIPPNVLDVGEAHTSQLGLAGRIVQLQGHLGVRDLRRSTVTTGTPPLPTFLGSARHGTGTIRQDQPVMMTSLTGQRVPSSSAKSVGVVRLWQCPK